jgi:carboxyl-terminal processing protease
MDEFQMFIEEPRPAPQKMGTLWVGVALAAMLVIGVVVGVLLDRIILSVMSPAVSTKSTEVDTDLIREAEALIRAHYVDQEAVDADRLTYAAISGMVDALGDTGHSRFLSPEMLEQHESGIEGSFEGIGAWVEFQDGYVVIVAPFDGSPAQEAGLQPGDVILRVDDEDMTGQSQEYVISHILGPAGTKVKLTVLDPDTGDIRDVEIVRARIEIHAVTWTFVPGTTVAHIRIQSFRENVTEDLQAALEEAQEQGMTGLILDLRNNPGGLLDEAVGVTSQFVEEGSALLEQDAQGKIEEIPVTGDGVAYDVPMVVLINGGSASASEIVAGALQDAGRAAVVGETTFGTGTVLQTFSLSDGSAMLLAVTQWLTPGGRVIWHQGIAPDVEVTLPLGAELLGPDAARDLTPEEFGQSADAQLLKALELLIGATSTTPTPR